jgi:hypothetical protein
MAEVKAPFGMSLRKMWLRGYGMSGDWSGSKGLIL